MRLKGNGVNPRQNFVEHIFVVSEERQTVAKAQMIRIVLAIRSANDAEVFSNNEAKNGMVACLVIAAFPGVEERFVSLSVWRFIRQLSDERNPALFDLVLEWPSRKVVPCVADAVRIVLNLSVTRLDSFFDSTLNIGSEDIAIVMCLVTTIHRGWH